MVSVSLFDDLFDGLSTLHVAASGPGELSTIAPVFVRNTRKVTQDGSRQVRVQLNIVSSVSSAYVIEVNMEARDNINQSPDALDSIEQEIRDVFTGATPASTATWTFSSMVHVRSTPISPSVNDRRYVVVFRVVAAPTAGAGLLLTGSDLDVTGIDNSQVLLSVQVRDTGDISRLNPMWADLSVHAIGRRHRAFSITMLATQKPLKAQRLTGVTITLAAGQTYTGTAWIQSADVLGEVARETVVVRYNGEFSEATF